MFQAIASIGAGYARASEVKILRGQKKNNAVMESERNIIGNLQHS